jgi:hypothetical protein
LLSEKPAERKPVGVIDDAIGKVNAPSSAVDNFHMESAFLSSRAREARIELGVLPLLVGHISVVRAEFDGGEITVTRKATGARLCAAWWVRRPTRHRRPCSRSRRM